MVLLHVTISLPKYAAEHLSKKTPGELDSKTVNRSPVVTALLSSPACKLHAQVCLSILGHFAGCGRCTLGKLGAGRSEEGWEKMATGDVASQTAT
jgi:hypothetical protein